MYCNKKETTMKRTATIKGKDYEITALPYTPNEYYTREQFNRRIHNTISTQWESYKVAVDMLAHGLHCLGPSSLTNPSQKEMRSALDAIRTAFMLELMKYLLIIGKLPEGAVSVDWNQSGGNLDVWSYDIFGHLIPESEYTILF